VLYWTCNLTAGVDSDYGAGQVGVEDNQPFALMVFHRFAAAATVSLACKANDNFVSNPSLDVHAYDTKLIAIKVSGGTNLTLP